MEPLPSTAIGQLRTAIETPSPIDTLHAV